MVLKKIFFKLANHKQRTANDGHGNFVQAEWFQRRRFFYKLTNQKQELPMAVMFVN
jgi:hypothetical protein